MVIKHVLVSSLLLCYTRVRSHTPQCSQLLRNSHFISGLVGAPPLRVCSQSAAAVFKLSVLGDGQFGGVTG